MQREDPLARSSVIDNICDQFEKKWLAGKSPRIEDALTEHAEIECTRMLRELLLIELEIRLSNGESPTAADYATRFPQQSDVIDDVLQTIATRVADPEETETVDVSFRLTDGTYVPTDAAVAETIVPGSGTEPARPTFSESAGERFGDYELLDEIARGGMGVVYKARQTKLNRIVALKMIKSGELAGDEEVQRFHAEAEAAAALDHPGIVPIYEVGEQNGQHFFSMGFVEGQGLNARLKDGPLPPREAADLIRTIAEAVQYAHDKGIVHRDLKPANVLIDVDGKPRITDFGLAKNIHGDSGMTATGQVMGTPSYMPPEQAAGKTEEIGPLADVYSLGAMLYALLTARPPFHAANVMETLKQVLEQEPVSPRVLNTAVDKDLETICLTTLQKDAAKRYASVSEFSADLSRYLENKPILARPIGRPARLLRWCKRNPLGATVAGLVAFLAIAGQCVAIYQIEMNRRLDTALAGETEQRLKAETKEKEARESERKMGIALMSEREALARKDKALLETEAAIDRYVKTVKEAELLKDPRFKGLLRALLKDAFAHYARFVEEHRSEQGEQVRIRMAKALYEIGYISSNKGSKDVAIEAFQESRAIREKLVKHHPTAPQHWHDLAVNHLALSHLYRSIGKRSDALVACQEALRIGKRLLLNHPHVHDFRRNVASSYRLMAVLYHEKGDRTKAQVAYRQALDLLEQLARDKPADRSILAESADNHNSLALLYPGPAHTKQYVTSGLA